MNYDLGMFSGLDLGIPISPVSMVLIFLVLFTVWVIHAVVLRYHWGHYGNGDLLLLKINLVYFAGSAILFAMMAIFILLYSFT